jgi:phosphoserine aminotransferase
MHCVRNFSGGPGDLPRSVLLAAQQAVVALPGTAISVLGLSHRSRLFGDILGEAQERLRRLLGLPPSYHVLFLPGGGSRKAVEAAGHHGNVRVAWDGARHGYRELPAPGEELGRPEGLQFRWVPRASAPRVCDASSNFLSKPFDASPLSLVYAHAQKNVGPAGVTIVLVRDDVLVRRPAGLAPVLDYAAHAEAGSLLHTPPVFAIYVVLLSLRWLEDEVGGLAPMGKVNAEKARIVRDALSASHPFYRHEVQSGFESDMNVTFRCPTAELDACFVTRAVHAGLVGTEGHRKSRRASNLPL